MSRPYTEKIRNASTPSIEVKKSDYEDGVSRMEGSIERNTLPHGCHSIRQRTPPSNADIILPDLH